MPGPVAAPKTGQEHGTPADGDAKHSSKGELCMSVPETPQLSVVVPTYQGDAWILGCLDSLAAQTLPWRDFEVVVVLNGPTTRTPDLVAGWLAKHQGFRLELVEADHPGVSHARNVGLDAARGTYVTFVDDDDRAAPRMLAALLSKAGPQTITAVPAGFVTDADFTGPDFGNWYTLPLLEHVGTPVPNDKLINVLNVTWGKLVATAIARTVRFDERLTRVGEDRVFWMSVLASAPLRIELVSLGSDATYLYQVREDGLSLRADALEDWDTHLEPWLATAAALQAIPTHSAATEAILRELVTNVIGVHLNAWLRVHPEDMERMDRVVHERGLDNFRTAALRWHLAREIAFLGTSPASDAARVSLGARVRERGAVTDIVAYVGERGAAATEPLLEPARDLVDQLLTFSGPTTLSWPVLGALVERLLEEVDTQEQRKPGPYLRLLSRSAGPVEHLLAAFVKLARPQLSWTAEPVTLASSVPEDAVTVQADRWLEILAAGLVEAGHPLDEVPEELGPFAELVMLGLADEVIFESAEQRERILARCPAPTVVARFTDERTEAAPVASRPAPADVPASAGADEGRPAVSVVVPTHGGDAWIQGCLDSLAAQTLDHDRFEIVVVQNGPRTHTRRIVGRFTAAHPRLHVEYVEADRVGVSHARNLGLDAARGAYVTFVDDDDRVAPRFLEALLAEAAPYAIPIAPVDIVLPTGRAVFENWLNAPVLPFVGREASNADLAVSVHPAWAKLVATEVARRVRFDERLGFGEDTAFWVAVLASGPMRLVLTDFGRDAAYLHHRRADSTTAQLAERTWEFNVLAHLDAVAAIDAVVVDDNSGAGVPAIKAAAVATLLRTVRGYTQARPDELARVDEAIRERRLHDVPWQVLHEGAANDLAVVGVRDAAAGRRFAAHGRLCDVLVLPAVTDDPATTLAPAEEVVDQLVTIGAEPDSWDVVAPLASQVFSVVASLARAKNRVHGALLSCSGQPLEHIVAALLKLARPQLAWTAELVPADDVPSVPVGDDATLRMLLDGLAAAGFPIEERPADTARLAEVLVLGLADEVVFAGATERAQALAGVGAELSGRAAARSRAHADARVVAVMGSCITRDNFNSRFNPGYRDGFVCPLHQNQTSVVSLMSAPVAASWSPVKEMSDYDRWNIDTELDKSFLGGLIALQPDVLILDFFADVHFGLVQLDTGEYLTDNRWKLQHTDLYQGWQRAGRLRRLTLLDDTETYLPLWRAALGRFLDFVREQLPQTRIVLHRGRNTNTLAVPGGEPLVLNRARPMADLPVEEANRLWAALDDHAAALVDGVIDLTDRDYPSFDEHPWGPFYVHYAMDYYPRFLAALEVVAGSDEPDESAAPAPDLVVAG
jgi:glycosyltransferase involved in cell wall biosynthesis